MKIVEAVLFNNELELLEARFHEGADSVDRWVIIESGETFTGVPKQYHLARHFKEVVPPSLYDRFDVLYVPRAGMQMLPWDRESYQRNALGAYLGHLDDDDLIVLSDADELTRRDVWPEIIKATADGGCVSLHKPTWYYTLTWSLPDIDPTVTSYRSKATRVSTLRSIGSVSRWANDMSYPVVRNSGWHLSCLGGPARLLEKIRSFSHQEINTPEWATYENCRRLIADGVDCVPTRGVTLTRTEPAGPEWLITEGVRKYPWLLSGEDACIQLF